MPIYNIEGENLSQIKQVKFKNERELQNLTEKNLEELFNLKFVATEFQVDNLIIDTLAFNEETNSFVIIEYHSLQEIDKFSRSFIDVVEDNYELIVSSNSNYTDEEQRSIISQYPFAKWIFNEKNGGFAYGMNEGLKVAQGDVLAEMNPDVKLIS